MTTNSLIFLNESRGSGNIVTRKGTIMAQGRGYLAAALATAMAVMPSLAPAQEKVNAKPANDAKVAVQDDKPTLIREAINYSKEHPVVVIAIAKGQKESLLTGEKIGDTLADVLKKGYQGTPSKYFVAPGGDYTAVGFVVDGHLYGPYGLKDSLVAIGVAAGNYQEKVRRGIFPPPETATTAGIPGGVTAKPEPQQ